MSRCLFIPGQSIPEGSTTAYVTKTGHINTTHANKQLGPWRTEVTAMARQITGPTITYPDGPVSVRVWFILPRTKGERINTRPHTRRPDLDKLIRAILDALTGVVYTDDAQVHRILAHKRTAATGETPGALIEWDRP